MSLPRPIRLYHFHADLIWWDGPFKVSSTKTNIASENETFSYQAWQVSRLIVISQHPSQSWKLTKLFKLNITVQNVSASSPETSKPPKFLGKTTVTNWSNARPKLDVACVVDLHQSQVPGAYTLPRLGWIWIWKDVELLPGFRLYIDVNLYIYIYIVRYIHSTRSLPTGSGGQVTF